MQRFLAPLIAFVDALVHPAVAGEPGLALRHRSFIAAHLGIALSALGILPLWLVVVGPPSPGAALAFAWLASPLAIAIFLSRTGRFDIACLASVSIFAALISWVAARTGGPASPAVAAFVLVPIAAALSSSPKIIAGGAAAATVGVLAIVLFAQLGPAAEGILSGDALADLLPVLATVSAGGLALRLDRAHRLALKRVQESEEHYRLLVDNAADLITRHGPNGDVEFASPAAQTVVGVPTSALLGDGLYQRVHVADRPAYLQALSEAFHSGRPTHVEFRLRCVEPSGVGSHATVFRHVAMLCDLARFGSLLPAVVAVVRDVSAMVTARAAAEEASLAKTNFLAHVSHELRTPLNAIIGFSQVLDESPDTKHRSDYIKLIRSAGEHLLEVVNGILDMSKIESGMFDISLESFDLPPLIEGCATMMATQAQQREVTLKTTVDTDVKEIVADERALRQIILNLVSNAIKFTEPGGRVEVAVRAKGEAIALSVSDTGIGIDAKDLPKLGTPFVQVDSSYQRRYEGTGLGLSIVKGLVGLHSGRVEIRSRPGAGTTVTVTLPIRGVTDRTHPATADDTTPFARQHKELKRA